MMQTRGDDGERLHCTARAQYCNMIQASIQLFCRVYKVVRKSDTHFNYVNMCHINWKTPHTSTVSTTSTFAINYWHIKCGDLYFHKFFGISVFRQTQKRRSSL